MSSSPPITTTTIDVANATPLFHDPQVMSKTTSSRVTPDIEREDVDVPGTTEEHPAESDEPQCEPIEERFGQTTVEEHPAEAEEPQLQQRLSLVTMEDWDGIHNTCMEQAGCTLPTIAFTKDATPVNEDSLSPEKRESANSIMTARDLLSLSDVKLKRGLDKCLKIYDIFPIPLPIAVASSQEKTRLIVRIERIYGKWPGPFIFVEDQTRGQTPTLTEEEEPLEDSRPASPSNIRELYDAQKSTLDAAYTLLSYGHQLVHRLEAMKTFREEDVDLCVQVMEHTMHGIDLARSLAETWQRTTPYHIKTNNSLYRLSSGKAKRRNASAPYRRQNCPTCGPIPKRSCQSCYLLARD